MSYNHLEIEKKWQEYWQKHQTFYTDVHDFSKPKYYALDMFPYPSGVGLHAGHPEGYTATDIICRKKRMEGYNVLHPMGFDSFGLPAEQYAIATGNHPASFTEKNIETFRQQLKMLGFSYDWSKEISTCDPSFYKWTQWIFKKLFEANLAKCIEMPVNWCEALGTVLANDEVIDGKSERGNHPVVRKMMKQWVIDIVAYAEKLLEGLEEIDWPESTKEMQRNWIGKSQGAIIHFKVNNSVEQFDVFSTRPDTLFGATFCVLAPEHPLVDTITTQEYRDAVKEYKEYASLKSDIERNDTTKEKTGVFTGAYAINPVNQKLIPIWISDYVLLSYGSGAVMAVPAHDQRDYEFAKTFHLDIISVIEGDISTQANSNDGVYINSEFLNGMHKEQAISAMIEYLQQRKLGYPKVNYRLREWIFARQRYWGEPIPVILVDGREYVTLKDEDLPLILPELKDYSPLNGQSPLSQASQWLHVSIDGKKGIRETSTMPGSAGSSWYFLRYIDPNNEHALADYDLLKHWLPVDLYIGGPEHAVGHLLYARMWNHFLYDQGVVPVKEPFKKLIHQGMILGANGIKMGKRFPEFVVDPNVIVKEYGADTLRIYEMFMGPLEASKPWNDQGVEASRKWLERVYRLVMEMDKLTDENDHKLDYIYNYTVKKVSEDIEQLSLNTAISQMMIFINECYKQDKIYKEYILNFIKMLSCFAPHLGEEMYHHLTNEATIAYQPWPEYDESKLVLEEIEIVIQINGKLRGKFKGSPNEQEDTLKQIALQHPSIQSYIEGKEIKKMFVIKGRVINIVV